MFSIKSIVGYSEVEVASCHRMGGFGIIIKCIVGYIEVEVALCPRNWRDKYYHKVYCRIY